MNVPRLIYSGPPNEDALTKRVGTRAELADWLARGWRLTRQAAPETENDAPADRNPEAAEESPQAHALRTDGPTLAEYVAAGYLAENYPPQGYAPVEDPAPAPADSNNPAPPEAVADAPRPEDPEPSKASNRRKR